MNEWLNNVPKRSKTSGMQTSSEYVLSMGDELGKHVDKWIAVVGNSVVAKGNSSTEVYEAAKKAKPDAIPFIMRVPRAEVMVL